MIWTRFRWILINLRGQIEFQQVRCVLIAQHFYQCRIHQQEAALSRDLANAIRSALNQRAMLLFREAEFFRPSACVR